MATFDWECNECSHSWEDWKHSLKAPDPVKCPECSSKKIVRVMCAPKIHWQYTDKEVRIPGKRTSVYIRRK